MSKKPYIACIHDGQRIVVGLFAVMASDLAEARSLATYRIPTSGVDVVNVEVAVQEITHSFASPFSFSGSETFYTQTVI